MEYGLSEITVEAIMIPPKKKVDKVTKTIIGLIQKKIIQLSKLLITSSPKKIVLWNTYGRGEYMAIIIVRRANDRRLFVDFQTMCHVDNPAPFDIINLVLRQATSERLQKIFNMLWYEQNLQFV